MMDQNQYGQGLPETGGAKKALFSKPWFWIITVAAMILLAAAVIFIINNSMTLDNELKEMERNQATAPLQEAAAETRQITLNEFRKNFNSDDFIVSNNFIIEKSDCYTGEDAAAAKEKLAAIGYAAADDGQTAIAYPNENSSFKIYAALDKNSRIKNMLFECRMDEANPNDPSRELCNSFMAAVDPKLFDLQEKNFLIDEEKTDFTVYGVAYNAWVSRNGGQSVYIVTAQYQ